MSRTHGAAPSDESRAACVASIDAVLVGGSLDFFNGGSKEQSSEKADCKNNGTFHVIVVVGCMQLTWYL